MSYRILAHKTFIREVKRLQKKYKSLKNDLQALQTELMANPLCGVDLGGGVRKVRMPISDKNKGKSHGARVITFNYLFNQDDGTINLIFIYDKQERESISKKEIHALLNELGLDK